MTVRTICDKMSLSAQEFQFVCNWEVFRIEIVQITRCEDIHEEILLADIIAFWKTHFCEMSLEDARNELAAWTGPGHELFVILFGGEAAGFLHLGSRGGPCNWLEDIFVRAELRGRGIGSQAIQLCWDMIRDRGDETMYLEVVPANAAAIRLYHRLGFTNLNSITLNRSIKEKRQLGTETIQGLEFRTYRPHQG